MRAMLARMDYSAAEPSSLRAGDSVAWVRELPEHSASDGWALKYRILYPAGVAVDITTTGNGTQHSVALTAAQTASLIAGSATLAAFAEKGAGASLERVTFEAQAISILPNLATTANLDSRSAAQKGLADAKAALAAYMAGGRAHVAEYQVAGRMMKFRAADEIRGLIDYYEAEVGKERALQAVLDGGSPGRVLTRF